MRKASKHICCFYICLSLTLTVLMSAIFFALKAVAMEQASVSNSGWRLTRSFNTPRTEHTATLLPNGKVLVAGGVTCGFDYLSSAELYDPITGTWSYTGRLSVPRRGHTATLLPNGKVLVAGGEWGTDQFLNSAELYDPATETWINTGGLNAIHFEHSATLLADGKVLILQAGLAAGNQAEIYDPVTERWSGIASTASTDSGGQRATLLANGKVLVTRGSLVNVPVNAIAELYDPAAGAWSSTSNLKLIRYPYTATLLPNDKVLVTGKAIDGDGFFGAEIYDPITGTWSRTGGSMTVGKPILLPNGKVLSTSWTYTEWYDLTDGKWFSTTNPNSPLSSSEPVLLDNGKVLFSPPFNCLDNQSAALFDFRLVESGTALSVSAASYRPMGLAPGAIATSFGTALAPATRGVTDLPLPTQLAGTSIKVKDSAGAERLAPLFYVSPQQVNYQVPPDTAPGVAMITITTGNGAVSTDVALVRRVAPSLFAADGNGQGVAAAFALRIKADGSQRYEPIAEFNTAQNKFVAHPLDLGPAGEQVYLILFGTGLRGRRSLASVIAAIGGTYAPVSYAGAQGDFVGLDQVNVRVPRSLVGRGEVDVLLTVEALMANPVRINIK